MSLCYDFQKWTIVTLASVAISLIVGLVLMQYAHGQNQQTPIPLGQCATMIEGGVVIVDLTCPNHTETIKVLIEQFGYIINIETANEMNLQPTTDTIDKLKEMGTDLNYTLGR